MHDQRHAPLFVGFSQLNQACMTWSSFPELNLTFQTKWNLYASNLQHVEKVLWKYLQSKLLALNDNDNDNINITIRIRSNFSLFLTSNKLMSVTSCFYTAYCFPPAGTSVPLPRVLSHPRQSQPRPGASCTLAKLAIKLIISHRMFS